MTTRLHLALNRTMIMLIAATLAVGLFASGVWAGSTRGGSAEPATAETHGSFWRYDLETGYPTGPAGQPDFWNYDPTTGAKISDSSPGVASDELAALAFPRPTHGRSGWGRPPVPRMSGSRSQPPAGSSSR